MLVLFAQGVSVQGVSVLGGKCPGGKCPGGICPRGYMSWGVSVLGVSVQGVSVRGVYVLGVSVRGVHVRGGYVLEPFLSSLNIFAYRHHPLFKNITLSNVHFSNAPFNFFVPCTIFISVPGHLFRSPGFS